MARDPARRRFDTPLSLPTLEAHDEGLVVSYPMARRLIPWRDVTDVHLTDDELVLERRRWFDLRCDADAIDDAEAVARGLERARGWAER